MIQKSQFKTATRVVQLSNTVTWIRNYKNQFMDLTSTQSDAIIYILKNYQDNSLTANELMRDLQLSQSTVAGIISRLEAKGLICRRPAENDNRKNIIYPTAKGMVLEEDLKKKAVELAKKAETLQNSLNEPVEGESYELAPYGTAVYEEKDGKLERFF